MKLTAGNIARFIDQLPKNTYYNYINPRNNGLIKIIRVDYPEGPIFYKRFDPSKGETEFTKNEESISSKALWRLANAINVDMPFNVDRVFGASYNFRSVLETLLAYTPQFYFCHPGRVEDIDGIIDIRVGHKHLMWKPDSPHASGQLVETSSNQVISEIPATSVVYESLIVPSREEFETIDIARRHAQIQIALFLIGKQLNYRSWIAQNDRGIIYKDKRLSEYAGIIQSLGSENIVRAFEGAERAGSFIDCIWFKNGRLMPAVMEIEHTTGVTSGLSRMKNFYDTIPSFQTRYVIVAPDKDREHVINEANKPMFRELNTRYFPYSAVEELFAICQRRQLRGVTEEFLDCYMEPVLAS